jgi:two-component system cell cycle sensor histidine kinase/response regulator CckA
MECARPRVLLIEDDPDDYVMIRYLLSDAYPSGYELEWAKNSNEGLDAIRRNHHNVCLLDFRLGEHSGLELLRDARLEGYEAPIIILTGHGNYLLASCS